ncbi:Urea transporter [Clostridioides difficile]|nr:Urea transporter [Clostridioides difficile]
MLILIGIFIGSKKAGIVSIIANIIGFLIIILLGGDYSSINEGIFGYNVVLSAIALGVTFETAIHSYLAMILGIVLTAFIHLGLSTLLAPLGLPTLTWPFIFATWIMLFAGIKNQSV